MEALSFQRLQRVITSISAERRHGTEGKGPEEDEEDDSFFELELSVPDTDRKSCSSVSVRAFHSKDEPYSCPAPLYSFLLEPEHSSDNTQNDPKYNFSQSKRRILPIESSFLRPQSPISLLKSAPKFRVFMFRKSTKSGAEADKTEGTPLRNRRNFFTMGFKLKEAEVEPALTRDSSQRKNESASCSDSSPLHGWSTSKRFTKELIQKYLRLVKPLRVKVSKRQASEVRNSGELSPASVGSANREQNAKAPAGFRMVACRHLGKSKSASASVTGIMSPARRDDSLQQQHDGIESAILHCKRSFSSSRGSNNIFILSFCSIAIYQYPRVITVTRFSEKFKLWDFSVRS
ncbi:hypothetical protein SAY86_019100 [Trapa natans]|uniref:Membrane-associated kinase regulator 5 n=1 Tax=Trapa natans TaxID=22666 RepID=A0AAN7LS75_TRANT|nr:hypothetical protein SAY86_019100 [Trapa natans]